MFSIGIGSRVLKCRFGIRAILLVTILVAIPSAYLGKCIRQSNRDYASMAAIDAIGETSGAYISMSVDAESTIQRVFGIGEVEKLWIDRNRDDGRFSCDQLRCLTSFNSLQALCLGVPIDACFSVPGSLKRITEVELDDFEFEEALQTLESLGSITPHPFCVQLTTCQFSHDQVEEIETLPFVRSVQVWSKYSGEP